MGQLCALVSAMSAGLTAVLVKQLTAHDDPDKIVFLTNVHAAAAVAGAGAVRVALADAGGAARPDRHGPVRRARPRLAWCAGYAATDASLAMTFEFSKLPFAVAIAYLAFGETIDAWTWVGALIIFASAVYITRREAKLRAQRASTTGSARG